MKRQGGNLLGGKFDPLPEDPFNPAFHSLNSSQLSVTVAHSPFTLSLSLPFHIPICQDSEVPLSDPLRPLVTL